MRREIGPEGVSAPELQVTRKKASFWFLLDVKAETRQTAVKCCNLPLRLKNISTLNVMAYY